MSDFLKVKIKCYKDGTPNKPERETPEFYENLGIPVPKDIEESSLEFEFRNGRILKDEVVFYYSCAEGCYVQLKDSEELTVSNSLEDLDKQFEE